MDRNNYAMNQSSPHISVVVPVYRAEHCLEELYGRLKAALDIAVAFRAARGVLAKTESAI